jgi:hypothetical protein
VESNIFVCANLRKPAQLEAISGIRFFSNHLLFILTSSFEISDPKLDGEECNIDLAGGLYASHFYNKEKLNISLMHIVLTAVFLCVLFNQLLNKEWFMLKNKNQVKGGKNSLTNAGVTLR